MEDVAALSRQISLALVGVIILSSVRVVLRGVTKVCSYSVFSSLYFFFFGLPGQSFSARHSGSRAATLVHHLHCSSWLSLWCALSLLECTCILSSYISLFNGINRVYISSPLSYNSARPSHPHQAARAPTLHRTCSPLYPSWRCLGHCSIGASYFALRRRP
jgi:hypothetical protein